MAFKITAVLGSLLALASAQSKLMNLTELIATTPSLAGLHEVLAAFPDVATNLGKAKNVTLFAPNNAAVKALQASDTINPTVVSNAQVQALLDYHVVPGTVYASDITTTPTFAHTLLNSSAYSNVTDGQVVELQAVGSNVIVTSGLKLQSKVVTANVNYTGGVVHIIDQVLTPPLNLTSTAFAADLTVLAGALIETNLLNTLSDASDLTIFAPSNAAFAAIGNLAGNLTVKEIAKVLEYHVINGSIAYSSSLGNGTVATLAGNVKITVEDGAIFVNGARIINADILFSGGVIQVIDAVLNPANSTAKPDVSATTAVAQFAGASSAPIKLTSALPAPSTTVSNLVATTTDVAKGYKTQTGGAIGAGAGGTVTPTPSGKSGSSGSSSSSSSGGAAMPTGAVGVAALLGGAAAIVGAW